MYVCGGMGHWKIVYSELKLCELSLPMARKLILALGHKMEVAFMDGKLFASFTSRDVYLSDTYAQKGSFCLNAVGLEARESVSCIISRY